MVMKGCLGIALTLCVISLFVSSIIGLEMMNVLQMAFFAVAVLKESQPLLATLSELYPCVNGYNRMFDVVEDRFQMDTATLSKTLELMAAGPRFLMNFNYMFFAELFAVLVMGVVKLVQVKTKNKSPTLSKVY